MDSVFGWIIAGFILNGISLFILPYLWFKFWRLKYHFLISARFPKLTLFMSISMFICALGASINLYIMNIYNFNKAKAVSSEPLYPTIAMLILIVSFLFCQAIVYRAFLIYDSWHHQTYALQNQSEIIHSGFNQLPSTTPDIDTENANTNTLRTPDIHNGDNINKTAQIVKEKPQKILKWSIMFILILSLILFLVTLPSIPFEHLTLQRQLFPISFVMVMILGGYVLWKGRQMKESMLCKRETYMMSLLVILNVIMDNMPIEAHMRFFSGLLVGTYCIFDVSRDLMYFSFACLCAWIMYTNIRGVTSVY